MLDYNNLLFLLLVGLGAMVQTLTGFAMGLIIMGGVTAMGLASISDTAAVVSLVSLLNTSLALRRCYHLIDYSYVISLACAMLPAILLGVFIMSYLAEVYADGLRMLLGLVIVAAGTLLMLTPRPYAKASGILGKVLAGVAVCVVEVAAVAPCLVRQQLPRRCRQLPVHGSDGRVSSCRCRCRRECTHDWPSRRQGRQGWG